jgi:hypothetical protein
VRCSLRAVSGEYDVEALSGDELVRYVYFELVSSGSGVQIPFLGSLFSVDWGLLLRRQASDPLRRNEASSLVFSSSIQWRGRAPSRGGSNRNDEEYIVDLKWVSMKFSFLSGVPRYEGFRCKNFVSINSYPFSQKKKQT